MDDARLWVPVEQRLSPFDMRRRLLAHDRLAAHVGIRSKQGCEDAPLRSLSRQDQTLQLRRRYPLPQPAPEVAALAQPGMSLDLRPIEPPHELPDRLVSVQIAGAPDEVANAVPREQVSQVVVLRSDGYLAVPAQDAPHEARAASTHADHEHGLRNLRAAVPGHVGATVSPRAMPFPAGRVWLTCVAS